MKKLFKILALALGIGLLAAGLGMITSTPAPASMPLAVNLAKVSVPSVPVSNPLDSQNNPTPLTTLEASQPFETSCNVIGPFNVTGAACAGFQPVPAGKRLVIQEVDVTFTVATGIKPTHLKLFTSVPPSTLFHSFTATFMGTSAGLDSFATHQETRLYVGENQYPTCEVRLTGVSNSSNDILVCALSGFLVDVP